MRGPSVALSLEQYLSHFGGWLSESLEARDKNPKVQVLQLTWASVFFISSPADSDTAELENHWLRQPHVQVW